LIQAFSTGFPAVALFLVLSAWVNAIKPLRLLKQGQHEDAIISLSSSCFRRVLRLVLPITASTVIVWFLAQLDVFHMGYTSDNGWVVDTSPRPSESVGAAIWDLWRAFYTTWSEAQNIYDKVGTFAEKLTFTNQEELMVHGMVHSRLHVIISLATWYYPNEAEDPGLSDWRTSFLGLEKQRW
jgi:hypothetical protein